MFRRGKSFYVRLRGDYGDRWVSLGSDYEEASRRLREIRGGVAPTARLRVKEGAERWLETYVPTNRNAKNVKMAKHRVEQYLLAYFRCRKLASITAEDLRRYRIYLERKSITPQTVAHLLSDARCFLGWCADSGLIPRSPVPRKLLPRIQERPPDRLIDAEVEALARMSEPYGFIARFGLGTGLRWGEMTRAQSTDIQNGVLVVHQTKTGKVRRVPLPVDLRAELQSRVGKLIPYSPLASGAFTRMVWTLTGVRFHPHQMRHTFACQWLDRGGSLAALQAILGHSTIVTTQRYARLSDDHVRAEVERISGKSVANSVAG
jgi:integrase